MPIERLMGIKDFDLDKQIEWSELRMLWDKSRKLKVKFWRTFFHAIFNWSDIIRLSDYGAKVINSYKIPYKLPLGFEKEKKDNE
jgi:hypothetical protein